MTDIIDELTWRGLIAHSTDLDELRKALDTGVVTLYAGFDPTAPGMHIGNLCCCSPCGAFSWPATAPSGSSAVRPG